MKFYQEQTTQDMGTLVNQLEADRGSIIVQLFDTPSGSYSLIISYIDREEYFVIPESHDMYAILEMIFYSYTKTEKRYDAICEKDEIMKDIFECRLNAMDSILKKFVYMLHDEEFLSDIGG